MFAAFNRRFQAGLTERPHYRGKAFTYVLFLVVGVVLLFTGPLWLAVVFLVCSIVPLVTMSTGRNPRWMQSPLDPKR